MSVLTQNIYTRLSSDLIGFGASINPDGSVLTVTGPTIEYVTAVPTAVRNAGSLALRNTGQAYITSGSGVWGRLPRGQAGLHQLDGLFLLRPECGERVGSGRQHHDGDQDRRYQQHPGVRRRDQRHHPRALAFLG